MRNQRAELRGCFTSKSLIQAIYEADHKAWAGVCNSRGTGRADRTNRMDRVDRIDRAFSNRNPIPISDRSGSLREEGTTNQKKDRTISCPLIILPNNNLAQ
jgi:hypothetical protein